MIQLRKHGSHLYKAAYAPITIMLIFPFDFRNIRLFRFRNILLANKKDTYLQYVKWEQEYFLSLHYWIWMWKSHWKCLRWEELLNLRFVRPYFVNHKFCAQIKVKKIVLLFKKWFWKQYESMKNLYICRLRSVM